LSAIKSIIRFIAGAVFFVFIFLRVVLGLRQISFFRGWLRLELNMLMFVAGMAAIKSNLEAASIKYFIVQSIGSRVFLGSISLRALQSSNGFLILIMGLRLVLKLGLAPLHGWFVSVTRKIR